MHVQFILAVTVSTQFQPHCVRTFTIQVLPIIALYSAASLTSTPIVHHYNTIVVYY